MNKLQTFNFQVEALAITMHDQLLEMFIRMNIIMKLMAMVELEIHIIVRTIDITIHMACTTIYGLMNMTALKALHILQIMSTTSEQKLNHMV